MLGLFLAVACLALCAGLGARRGLKAGEWIRKFSGWFAVTAVALLVATPLLAMNLYGEFPSHSAAAKAVKNFAWAQFVALSLLSSFFVAAWFSVSWKLDRALSGIASIFLAFAFVFGVAISLMVSACLGEEC